MKNILKLLSLIAGLACAMHDEATCTDAILVTKISSDKAPSNIFSLCAQYPGTNQNMRIIFYGSFPWDLVNEEDFANMNVFDALRTDEYNERIFPGLESIQIRRFGDAGEHVYDKRLFDFNTGLFDKRTLLYAILHDSNDLQDEVSEEMQQAINYVKQNSKWSEN